MGSVYTHDDLADEIHEVYRELQFFYRDWEKWVKEYRQCDKYLAVVLWMLLVADFLTLLSIYFS
ncbi:hypothetical protein J7L13_02420 [bacterium]|nr:hypothetical protein [bacterium]